MLALAAQLTVPLFAKPYNFYVWNLNFVGNKDVIMRVNHFLSLCLIATVSNGYAGSMGDNFDEEGALYLKVFAGATFVQNQTVQVVIHGLSFPSETLDYASAGPLYGIGFGYRWPVGSSLGLRLEAEASHSSIKINNIKYYGLINSGLDYNRTTQNALFANAYVDYRCDKFVPYLGVGIGGANAATVYTLKNTEALNPRHSSNNNFAWQAIVGSSYRITDRVSLGLEYRYRGLGTDSFRQTTTDGVLNAQFSNLKNNSNNLLLNLEVVLDGEELS